MNLKYIKPFSVIIGNLQVRSCNGYLLLDGTHIKAEIVCHDYKRDCCWTIAIFQYSYSNENWHLSFIEDRPLEDCVDWNTFGELVYEGYNYLEDNCVYEED